MFKTQRADKMDLPFIWELKGKWWGERAWSALEFMAHQPFVGNKESIGYRTLTKMGNIGAIVFTLFYRWMGYEKRDTGMYIFQWLTDLIK